MGQKQFDCLGFSIDKNIDAIHALKLIFFLKTLTFLGEDSCNGRVTSHLNGFHNTDDKYLTRFLLILREDPIDP